MEPEEIELRKAELAAKVIQCEPIMVTTELLATANARLLAYLAVETEE